MSAAEKLIKYVQFDTQSDENSTTSPSTQKQLVLARELEKECIEMGMDSVILDDHGTVYAVLEAKENNENEDAIGFLGHMDTASELSGFGVKPRIIKDYDGKTIILNDEYSMEPEGFPALKEVIGDDLIVTDGTTLLGADDKAGIAIIMQAVEEVIKEDLPHGKIALAFTPDEEIGRGVDHFDLSQFPVDYAYTVDGAQIENVDYETFNAAQAIVEFKGTSIHPGDAKDKMVNACLVAMEYNFMLPKDEIPAKTENREGFYHLCEMSGNVDRAKLNYIIRDHDRALFEAKKEKMVQIGEELNKKYPDCVHVKVRDQYFNMVEYMKGDMRSVDRAKKALQSLGIEPVSLPIRGGTDGAMLTYKGLITPNLGTGSNNHHGRFEFASINKMNQMVNVLKAIIKG